jgi:sugar phosphate isomerase/epimerase
VTPEIRNRVKLLLALGWAVQRIANAVDASAATVKRYFRAELKERDAMRDRLDARRLEIAATQAMTGSPSAIRIFNQMVETNDRMEATRKIAAGGDRASAAAGAQAKPPEKVAAGKKEQKQTDAAAAIAADPDLFARPATKH